MGPNPAKNSPRWHGASQLAAKQSPLPASLGPLWFPFTAVWPQVIIGTLRVPGSFHSHVSDHFTHIN